MSATCPKCNKPLTWSVGERLTPKLKQAYTFDCPHCGSKLIFDYWSLKQGIYRNLLGVSAIIFYFVISALNINFWILLLLLITYIFIVVNIYFRVRKAIFADNRLNQKHNETQKQPWE